MVKSVAGRDCGMYAYVVGKTEEGFLLVADGRIRKVEAPKRKKT
jgi:ribosomal protein L14E/L6E/L27E